MGGGLKALGTCTGVAKALFFVQDMGNLSYSPNLRSGRLRSNLTRVEAARVDQLSVTIA